MIELYGAAIAAVLLVLVVYVGVALLVGTFGNG